MIILYDCDYTFEKIYQKTCNTIILYILVKSRISRQVFFAKYSKIQKIFKIDILLINHKQEK